MKNPKALLSSLLVVMLRPSNLSVKMVRLPSREALETDQEAAAAARDAADMEEVLRTAANNSRDPAVEHTLQLRTESEGNWQ
jgi:hypothetical protein